MFGSGNGAARRALGPVVRRRGGAVGSTTVRDADVVDPDRPMLPPETVEESDEEYRAP